MIDDLWYDDAPSCTAVLDRDPDTQELVLPIPPPILEKMDWRIGDRIVWQLNDDGSVLMRKIDD